MGKHKPKWVMWTSLHGTCKQVLQNEKLNNFLWTEWFEDSDNGVCWVSDILCRQRWESHLTAIHRVNL